MRAYVINIMVVLIIFPVILQRDINMIMLSIGGQGTTYWQTDITTPLAIMWIMMVMMMKDELTLAWR